jgi:membrane protease YdiL (CAAX protease family)
VIIAILELAIVALIFFADAHHLIYLSKTPYLLLLGWISLRLRGLRWRDVGFARPASWTRAVAIGLIAGAALESLELLVTQPFLVTVLGKQPDLDMFRALHGNLKWTALALLGAWSLAAFGEEMVYRGYLMNRVADLFHRTRAAWITSLLSVPAGFGLAHAYQGITGVIDEGLMGLLLGILYLANGRNLVVPIIAHGVSDSIDFILMYLGRYPGLS